MGQKDRISIKEFQWNTNIIEKIHKQKEKERSQDRDNLLKIVSSLSGEDVHFIFELIQNADDEGAENVYFEFNKRSIIIYNDGKRFTKDDVWNVCSAGRATKKNKIGFFGIGFKSVFVVSDNPQIISGNYNFSITDFIYPRKEKLIPPQAKKLFNPNRGSIFVLKLKLREGIDGEKIAIDTEKRLNEKHILFLDNIINITFNDRIRNKRWKLKKEKKLDDSIELYTNFDGVESCSNWTIFQEKQIPPKGLKSSFKKTPKETKITIAIPKNINSETITHMKQEPIYCYLPTRQQTGLPFLIQADFEPIPGRSGIAKTPLNQWLLKCLGKLAAQMICDIALKRRSNDDTFLLIPPEDYVNVDLSNLVENLFKKLSRKKFVFDVDGNTVTPRRCALISNVMKDILYKTDLKRMKKKDLHFIITDFLDDHTIRLLKILGAIEIDNKDIITLLNRKRIISKRGPEWFLNVYKYISTVFDSDLIDGDKYDGTDEEQKLFSKLLVTSFLLTNNLVLIAPKDSKNRLRIITYQQKTDITKIASVLDKGEWFVLHKYFQISTYIKGNDPALDPKREDVKKFLEKLRVKKYINHRNVIEKIVIPKLYRIKDVHKDRSQIYDLTDYIRQKLSSYKTEIKKSKPNITDDAIFNFLKEKLPVLSFTPGKKKNMLKKGDDIYFPKAYGKSEKMQTLFKGITGIYFLSPYYIGREKTLKKQNDIYSKLSWKKFFDKIGVWSSPIVHQTEEYINVDGSWNNPLIGNLNGRDFQIWGDANSEDLDKFLKYVNTLTDRTKSIKYMLLWETLDKNWERKYKKVVKNTKVKYFHYKLNIVDRNTSTFLESLRNRSWVAGYLGKKMDLFEPTKLYLLNITNKHLLGPSKPFLAWKGKDDFIRDIQVQRFPSTEVVIKHLRNLRAKVPKTKRNIIEKIETIYSFLYSEVFKRDDEESSWHLYYEAKEIISLFNKEELIYIPRKIGNHWWSPNDVFIEDLSETFGAYRGYLTNRSGILYKQQLEPFFLSLGVNTSTSLSDCVKMLEQLSTNKDITRAQTIGQNIFRKIDTMLENNLEESINWNKAIFLSCRKKFRKPNEIFYNNNSDLIRLFDKHVEILYIPYTWNNIKNFLITAGIMGINDIVIREKKIGGISSLETDVEERIRRIAEVTHKYLLKRKPDVYSGEIVQSVVAILDEMSICEADKIDITFKLPKQVVSKPIVKRETRQVYWSPDENQLYVSKELNPFSTDVAKEMSELFGELADYAFLVIDSLITCGLDEEEFLKKVNIYDISDFEEAYESPIEIEIMEPGEADIDNELEIDDDSEQLLSLESEIELEEIAVTSQKRQRRLINPSEYGVETVVSPVPYKFKDGGVKHNGREAVKTREGVPSPGGKIKLFKEMVPSKVDAESLSYFITMAYEKDEGWKPNDRHKQRTIGYDIYSKKGSSKKFIEVKYFSRKAGTFTLTEYEWAKAKKEKSRYFVYVVSGLEEGSVFSLSIICNPCKYTVPEEPSNKQIRRWDSAVCKKIIFKKRLKQVKKG